MYQPGPALAHAGRNAHATGEPVISLDAAPEKHGQARDNLREAGLLEQVELVTGDAAATILALPGPFNYVLLDAWKSDYISCFEALRPKLNRVDRSRKIS